MQTEIAFTLPVGFVDDRGETHRHGIMRLATARDEIEPLRDPHVRANGAYLSVLLLARTVTRIGSLTDVTPALVDPLQVIEVRGEQPLHEGRVHELTGAQVRHDPDRETLSGERARVNVSEQNALGKVK